MISASKATLPFATTCYHVTTLITLLHISFKTTSMCTFLLSRFISSRKASFLISLQIALKVLIGCSLYTPLAVQCMNAAAGYLPSTVCMGVTRGARPVRKSTLFCFKKDFFIIIFLSTHYQHLFVKQNCKIFMATSINIEAHHW